MLYIKTKRSTSQCFLSHVWEPSRHFPPVQEKSQIPEQKKVLEQEPKKNP